MGYNKPMQRSHQMVRMAFMAVVGILLGVSSTPKLEATRPIQSEFLGVLESEVTTQPQSGRGTGIRENQIRLEHYAFGRHDTLSCLKPIQNLQITVDPKSAPIRVTLKTGNQRHSIELSANGWRMENQSNAQPYSKPWSSTLITHKEISDCSLAPQNGAGRLSSLAINGNELVVSPSIWTGAFVGGIIGLLLGWKQHRLSSYVLLTLTTVTWYTIKDWISIAEQFALTNTPGNQLAQTALWIGLWPWLCSLFVRPIQTDHMAHNKMWWMGGVIACALATWQTPTPWAVVGIALVFAPGFLHRNHSFRNLWLNGDWPALIFFGFLGWKWGTLAAISWRLIRIIMLRQTLLERGPSFAADQLAMTLISLIVATEIGLRASYLNTAWSPENLAGEATETDNWRKPVPFWSAQCLKADQREHGLVYLGGSSTGGAYQFGTEPEAFFSAQIHERLCQKRSIQTWNYGAAERDSHTISRTLDQILTFTKAKWVVLYIGHNDLTADNPFTRLEREQRSDSILVKIGKMARNIRIIAGSDLLFRMITTDSNTANIAAPPLGPDGQPMRSQVMHQGYPMAVPIEDARQNLIQIQSIAASNQAQVILVPQLIAQQSFNDLSSYWALEEEVAAQFSNIHLIDVRQLLRQKDENQLLEDNNHFSRLGHQELARYLEPELERLISSFID